MSEYMNGYRKAIDDIRSALTRLDVQLCDEYTAAKAVQNHDIANRRICERIGIEKARNEIAVLMIATIDAEMARIGGLYDAG